MCGGRRSGPSCGDGGPRHRLVIERPDVRCGVGVACGRCDDEVEPCVRSKAEEGPIKEEVDLVRPESPAPALGRRDPPEVPALCAVQRAGRPLPNRLRRRRHLDDVHRSRRRRRILAPHHRRRRVGRRRRDPVPGELRRPGQLGPDGPRIALDLDRNPDTGRGYYGTEVEVAFEGEGNAREGSAVLQASDAEATVRRCLRRRMGMKPVWLAPFNAPTAGARPSSETAPRRSARSCVHAARRPRTRRARRPCTPAR
jgi:hypothetical protein